MIIISSALHSVKAVQYFAFWFTAVEMVDAWLDKLEEVSQLLDEIVIDVQVASVSTRLFIKLVSNAKWHHSTEWGLMHLDG